MRNTDIATIYATTNRQAHTKHLFIEGNSIYSYGYHFKIAQKVRDKVALFTTKDYSQTTSCHKNRVSEALESAGYTLIKMEL